MTKSGFSEAMVSMFGSRILPIVGMLRNLLGVSATVGAANE